MLLHSCLPQSPATGCHHKPQYCCSHHQQCYISLLFKVSHKNRLSLSGFFVKRQAVTAAVLCLHVVCHLDDLFVHLVLGLKLSGGTQFLIVKSKFFLCIQASKR